MCARLNLPREILTTLEKKGLHSLYKWQSECLKNTGVLDDRNLVYCAPTSGGKSLVADLMVIRAVLRPDAMNAKVVIVLPFVSLVQEKVRDLKALLASYNQAHMKDSKVQVKPLYGESTVSLRKPKALNGRMIVICTIEKSSVIVNALLKLRRIDQLKLVVIDELHLLQDSTRGYMLEILVSKIKAIEAQAKRNANVNVRIKLIALSATIGNIDLLSAWFDASLYCTTYRPVPLHEYIKCGSEVLAPDGTG